jgi:hypothetical protein
MQNYPNHLIKSSLQQQEEVASSSESKEHNDTSSLRRKLSYVNTTPPPEGLSVRCIEEPKRVFLWTGTELRHYPSGKIASSWDPEWRDVASLQCEGLTIGSPMSFNYGALPPSNRRNKLEGRAMPDNHSDPGVLAAEVSAAMIRNVEDKMSVYINDIKGDTDVYRNDVKKDMDVYRNDVKKDMDVYINNVKKDMDVYINNVKKDMDDYRNDVKKDMDVFRNDVKKDMDVYINDVKKDMGVYTNDAKDIAYVSAEGPNKKASENLELYIMNVLYNKERHLHAKIKEITDRWRSDVAGEMNIMTGGSRRAMQLMQELIIKFLIEIHPFAWCNNINSYWESIGLKDGEVVGAECKID